MTNPTPAAAPDPARWLTELMANPLSPLQSFGSDNPATPFAALPMPMFAPWLEATNAFVQWQQQAVQQLVALSPWPGAPTSARSRPLREIGSPARAMCRAVGGPSGSPG